MRKRKSVTLVLLPNTQLTNPTMYAPLGLLYVASVFLNNECFVTLVDLRKHKEITKDTLDLIPESQFVGFTATAGEIGFAKDLNRLIKKSKTRIKTTTIVGGPHAVTMAEDCADFDVTVAGEGELVVGQILSGRRNILFPPRIKMLDDIPFPAWHLLDKENRFSNELFLGEKYGHGELSASVITSRGCPFDCSFCANCWRTPVVFRSAKNVCAEIAVLSTTYGVRHFRFEDDTFTLDRNRFFSLCERLKHHQIHYRCHTKAGLLTEEMAKLAFDSGCREMAVGVESGDNKVLQMNDKQITIQQCIDTIQLIKDAGIRTKVYLISGLPGESEHSVELTKQFMINAKPDKWTLSQFTPYPGSAVWNDPGKYGVKITNRNFKDYWNFPDQVSYEFINGANSRDLEDRYKELYKWLVDESNWKTTERKELVEESYEKQQKGRKGSKTHIVGK